MKGFQVLHLLIILIILFKTSTRALRYAKTGCNDTCGNVLIPYPFGIGPHCSINKWYVIDCNSSKPYLSAFNNLEVLSVSLVQQTVTVNTSMITDCRNPIWNLSHISIEEPDSPFLISKLDNVFVIEGCGNSVVTDNQGTIVAGCSTTCRNDTIIDESNSCYGVGCCQTTIPIYLKSLSLNRTGLEGHGGDKDCGVAYFVDDNSYVDGTFSSQSISGDRSFVPISLAWIITDLDQYDELPTNWQSQCSSYILDQGNNNSVNTFWCECRRAVEGNPYLTNGCKEEEECTKCERSGGFCYYRQSELMTCLQDSNVFGRSKTSLGVVLGVSISMGLLLLMVIIYALYKLVKKRKATRRKQRSFKRNGGLLLKQQEASNSRLVDKTILFTSNELEKATDHFNENRILGRGGQGIVYKGMLADGRIVAIKKSKVVDESQIDQFINEVVVLSQVNHRNVVKLLGCCLETEVPLLVSEFISNGNLYNLIQNETSEFSFSLNMRLQIATEVAGAVSYLHSATSTPIYHRDIKSTNILLDETYRAKVSDFGTSRFVSIGETHLTTLVKGTFGYLDPEYFQSSQFTEKSDVYSFGVVLLELLTREKPISLTRFGEHRSLSTYFMLAMEQGQVMSIFDATVVKEGSREELLAIAKLAMRCLDSNGKNRPTMKEVALELESMRMSHVPAMVHDSLRHIKYDEDFAMIRYEGQTSLTMEFDDRISI